MDPAWLDRRRFDANGTDAVPTRLAAFGREAGWFCAEAELTAKVCQKGAKANASGRSSARGGDLAPVIAELQASGASSLRAIANALNDRGIPTARGGNWFAASVRDVLARSEGE